MAEFGFLGVVVYTRVQTPLRCGHESSAADLLFLICSALPLRTNCDIVGINYLIKISTPRIFGAANVAIFRNKSNPYCFFSKFLRVCHNSPHTLALGRFSLRLFDPLGFSFRSVSDGLALHLQPMRNNRVALPSRDREKRSSASIIRIANSALVRV
jgi:hypothetical protein